MKGMKLFEAMTELDDDLLLDAYAPKPAARLGWKITLVAAVVSLLVVTVFASVVGRAEIVATPRENGYAVTFRAVDLLPSDVGYWYPQELPEDYEAHWIGSNEGNRQSMNFICDRRLNFTIGDGGVIHFTYGVAWNMPEYVLENVYASEKCQISGHQAQLFRSGHETTVIRDGEIRNVTVYEDWLFWIDAERKIGFMLRFVGYTPVDLVAMAESVTQVEELTATYEVDVGAAVMKLGDYDLPWLPADYAYAATYGRPAYPLTRDPYSGYVHKVYRDPEFHELHLYYEYLPNGCSSIAGVDAQLLQASALDLNGVAATYYETPEGEPYAIVWQREDTARITLTFTLRTDSLLLPADMTKEELIRAAESLALTQPADTTVPGWLK